MWLNTDPYYRVFEEFRCICGYAESLSIAGFNEVEPYDWSKFESSWSEKLLSLGVVFVSGYRCCELVNFPIWLYIAFSVLRSSLVFRV